MALYCIVENPMYNLCNFFLGVSVKFMDLRMKKCSCETNFEKGEELAFVRYHENWMSEMLKMLGLFCARIGTVAGLALHPRRPLCPFCAVTRSNHSSRSAPNPGIFPSIPTASQDSLQIDTRHSDAGGRCPRSFAILLNLFLFNFAAKHPDWLAKPVRIKNFPDIRKGRGGLQIPRIANFE